MEFVEPFLIEIIIKYINPYEIIFMLPLSVHFSKMKFLTLSQKTKNKMYTDISWLGFSTTEIELFNTLNIISHHTLQSKALISELKNLRYPVQNIAINHFIKHGSLETVKWCYGVNFGNLYTVNLQDAVTASALDMVEWLCENGCPIPSLIYMKKTLTGTPIHLILISLSTTISIY